MPSTPSCCRVVPVIPRWCYPGRWVGRPTLVAALGRGPLSLIVAAKSRTSVRTQRRSVERHERQLGDRQTWVEPDRHACQVVELERQRPLEARVAETRRRVDDQAQSPETRLALDPRDDVIGDLNPLERAPETELAGVDDERIAGWDDDLLSQVRRRVAQVDRRGPVVVKDAERVSKPQIDTGRLDHRRIPRFDLDPSLLLVAEDGAVGEHRGCR